jgi:antitoxin VapB
MNMQINIKSREARELADEITKRTGETMTEVITKALRDRLAKLTLDERKAVVDAIIEDMRGRWTEPLKSMDHGDLLYDKMGLPK